MDRDQDISDFIVKRHAGDIFLRMAGIMTEKNIDVGSFEIKDIKEMILDIIDIDAQGYFGTLIKVFLDDLMLDSIILYFFENFEKISDCINYRKKLNELNELIILKFPTYLRRCQYDHYKRTGI